MTSQDIYLELQARIQNDLDDFGHPFPERFAIAWRAYLAAILEWGIIDMVTYDELLQLLPPVPNDPSVVILQGRDEKTNT